MRVSPIGGGARLHLKPLSLGHYGKFFVSGQRYKLIFKYKTIAQCLRLRSTRKAAFTLAEVFLPYYLSPRRIAFTLAEVLITLGIIGVVAAMTLPTLINNSRNRELEAALKKNYSAIQQAFDMYQAKNGERLLPKNIGYNKLKGVIMPYFKVIKDCGAGHEAVSSDPECGMINSSNINNRKSNYKNYNGAILDPALFDDGQFILSDGSIIFIENMADASFAVYISVDVNGAIRPNQYGHDLFTFQLMNDGKILPMGSQETNYTDKNNYCSQRSSYGINGIACTYYALTDKNYWKNLK